MVKPSAIALFVYNRPEHTAATLRALSQNSLAKDSDLFIFSDGPKYDQQRERVLEVRKYIHHVKGFKSVNIRESDSNQGLARSLVGGISEVFKAEDRLIVLEDDIVTSPDFLTYLNQALERYENDPKIHSVTGFQFPFSIPDNYEYDSYLSYRASSWGWGTWKSRWENADWAVTDYAAFQSDSAARKRFNRGGNDLSDMLDRQMNGEIDSWAIRWAYAHFKAGAFCLYPTESRAENIGFDGSGTHCGTLGGVNASKRTSELDRGLRFPPSEKVNEEIVRLFYDLNSTPLRSRIKARVKKVIRKLLS